jgi:hypothetical protein
MSGAVVERRSVRVEFQVNLITLKGTTEISANHIE